nr:branchpoint-bridging protein-like [Manis javanica]
MLAGRERLSPAFVPAAAPPPPPPAPAAPEPALLCLGRAPAPLSSRAEKSQRGDCVRPGSAPASSPPSSSRPGTGTRVPEPPAQPSVQPRPLSESKREEPPRPPARASHPALCQQQTQTFPSPSPPQLALEKLVWKCHRSSSIPGYSAFHHR